MIALEPKERILCQAHRHFLPIAVETVFLAVLSVLPVVLAYSRPFSAIAARSDNALLGFLYAVWLILIWLLFIAIWTDYYLDVWIVTNHRLIDVEQNGLFSRRVSIFQLDALQDATVETKGVVATLLNYGDIHIQTAGREKEFVFSGIANPDKVKAIILRAKKHFKAALPQS